MTKTKNIIFIFITMSVFTFATQTVFAQYTLLEKILGVNRYVFVYIGGEDNKMILPKEDSSDYTLEELGIKSNTKNTTTQEDTSDVIYGM